MLRNSFFVFFLLVGRVSASQNDVRDDFRVVGENDLPTVEDEMRNFYELFKRKLGYDVKSTFFDDEGNVFSVWGDKKKDKMDGEYLFLSKYKKWIDEQVKCFEKGVLNGKYDGLIFVFSGHGASDKNWQGYVSTSGWEERFLWEDIQQCFSFLGGEDVPKLFFKFACRSFTSVCVDRQGGSSEMNWKGFYSFCSVFKGADVLVTDDLKLSKSFCEFFVKAVDEGKDLGWFNSRLHEERGNGCSSIFHLIADSVVFGSKVSEDSRLSGLGYKKKDGFQSVYGLLSNFVEFEGCFGEEVSLSEEFYFSFMGEVSSFILGDSFLDGEFVSSGV